MSPIQLTRPTLAAAKRLAREARTAEQLDHALDVASAAAYSDFHALVAEAELVVHHYYCRLPTEGKDRCDPCTKLARADKRNEGTMTLAIVRLAVAASRQTLI